MSKRVKADITCPACGHQFPMELYRSIWGEYPSNRELVMSDRINVADCPSCERSTKLPFAFIYTNADQHFAVWWEPFPDAQIDKDTAGYERMLGKGNYLATAPRIADWEEFKETIRQFERGELKGAAPAVSDELRGQFEGFAKSLEKESKRSGNGCLLGFAGLAIFIGGWLVFF